MQTKAITDEAVITLNLEARSGVRRNTMALGPKNRGAYTFSNL